MINKWSTKISENQIATLIHNYGSEVEEVLRIVNNDLPHARNSDRSLDLLKGETLFAIRKEMAQKVSDVVMRRTDLGTAGKPRDSHVSQIAWLMAKELQWNTERSEQEIQELKDLYPPFIK
jgi:glycerol-3-phosphate dehydrogenase